MSGLSPSSISALIALSASTGAHPCISVACARLQHVPTSIEAEEQDKTYGNDEITQTLFFSRDEFEENESK
jgi:hypothetical protein